TRMGRLIQFIPYPVTTGFTAGIATVIAILQIKDLFGLRTPPLPEGTLGKIGALWAERHSVDIAELGVGVLTLGLLILLPRWAPQLARRVPAPLFALTAAALAGLALAS